MAVHLHHVPIETIFAYAGVRTAVLEGRHDSCSQWPVIRCALDNVIAKANINKGTVRSPHARTLLKIFASIAHYSDVWLNTVIIPGKLNIMADFLSRNVTSFEQHPHETFRTFFSLHPQMASSGHFLPSRRLASQIWHALRTGTVTDPQLLKMQEFSVRDVNILGSFATIVV